MTSTHRPTAVVTGASRGIGKAIAVALAGAGYDVAITARTVREGAAPNPDGVGTIEGSLDTTAELIAAQGRTAVPVVLDLLDLDRLEPAWDTAVAGLGGHVDVLVNNAIYVGPGNDVRLAEVDPVDIVRRVSANVTAQVLLSRLAVRQMLGQDRSDAVGPQRRGTLVDITSHAGRHTPTSPVGRGGFPLTYAVTKAGFHRIADMLAVEYGDDGIFAVNVNPGYVATERVRAAEHLKFVADQGVRPEMIGEAVMKILADQTIANGGYVHAQHYLEPV